MELEQFFQSIMDHHQLGAVTNVTLAYKFKDSLENLLKVCEYRLQIQRYQKKISFGTISQRKKDNYIQKMNVLKRKAVLENNLAKEKLGLKKEEMIDYQNMADKKILKAFVSFEDSESTTKIRKIINDAYSQNSLGRCCFRKIVPGELLFRKKHKIRAKQPDNPSNINWANLEKSRLNVCWKVLISFLIIVLVLFVAMILNLLLQSFNTNYKKSNEIKQGVCTSLVSDAEMKDLFEKNQDFINLSVLTEEQTNSLAQDNYTEINNCYCGQYNYLQIISDQDNKYKYCEKIILTMISTVGMSIGTGVFISVINFVLVIVISNLILWIPFKSLSSQIAVQIVYITMALFINTTVGLTR